MVLATAWCECGWPVLGECEQRGAHAADLRVQVLAGADAVHLQFQPADYQYCVERFVEHLDVRGDPWQLEAVVRGNVAV